MLAQDKTQVSLRVPNDILAHFDEIARALERDRTWVMLRAFRHYLDLEGTEILDEAQGVAELDDGRGADFDDVLDKADAIIAAARNKQIKRLG